MRTRKEILEDKEKKNIEKMMEVLLDIRDQTGEKKKKGEEFKFGMN